MVCKKKKSKMVFGQNNKKDEVLVTKMTGSEDGMNLAQKLITPLSNGSKQKCQVKL